MTVTFTGIVFFLLLITVLVAAHELGHFLIAKLFGMHVEEFAIGFGRPYWVWMKRGGTEYTLRPIPLGGFVRTAGMEPKEDGSEIHVPNGFYSRPPFQRFLMLLAGPVFSLLAGIILLTGLFMSQGLPEFSKEPIIGSIAKGKSAETAGLKPGDRIVAVEGTSTKSFFDVVKIIRERPEIPTTITYERDHKIATTIVKPFAEEGPMLDENLEPTPVIKRQGKLGMLPSQVNVPTTVSGAFKTAVVYPYIMVARLVTTPPSKLKDEVGGPLMIFKVAQDQAKGGLADMVSMAGLLSMSLGIMNLFPMPPFDGGQMVVALVEMMRRGRRLSFRVQTWLSTAGIAVLMVLIVAIFTLDIGRLNK